TRLREVSRPETRLVVNFFNNLWRPILALAEKVGAKAPTLPQNWLSAGDMKNLLHLAEWEVIKQETRILWPLATPLIAPFFNRWLAPLMRPFCLTVFLVARPRPQPGNGGRNRNHFRGRRIQGQHLGRDSAGPGELPAPRYQSTRAARQRQRRRGAPGVRRRDGRFAFHSRRRLDHAARTVAEILRSGPVRH